MANKKFVDDEMFQRTLAKYIKHSKKKLPEVCNVKAYWVARNAIQKTHKASAAEIDSFAKQWHRSGPTIIKTYKLDPSPSDLTKRGKWKKSYKRKYMNKLSRYRKRSIGYLRAGWIPTLKKTGGWAKQSRGFRGVKLVGDGYGREKGYCKLARGDAWTIQTKFGNKTGFKTGQAEAAKKYVKPALQKAINQEAYGMARYIVKKMAEAKRKSGI